MAAGRKPQWRKKPEAPLGAKKISVEERAVSGKRAVPDKASDREEEEDAASQAGPREDCTWEHREPATA